MDVLKVFTDEPLPLDAAADEPVPRGQARDPRALVLEGGLLEGLGDRLGLALEERLQRRDRRGSGDWKYGPRGRVRSRQFRELSPPTSTGGRRAHYTLSTP